MQIETLRLILRDYTLLDLDTEHENNLNPELFKYMPFDPPNTKEDTRKRIERMIQKQKAAPRTDYDVAITLKSNKQLIGGCRLNKVSDIEGHIGYKLARDFWGKGYATEAAKALTDYGLNVLNLHRVYAFVHPDNAASIRVLEKVGMVLEGRLRENLVYRDGYRDSLIYSILEHEWSNTNR